MCCFPMNSIKTMSIPKSSWRQPPKSKKGAVICTRPIFPATFPAVKNHAIQRGSVRTICPANGRTEQPREGHERHCFQFQPTPLPGSHVIRICLPNPMLVAVPTQPGSHNGQSCYSYRMKKMQHKKHTTSECISWSKYILWWCYLY